MTVTATRANGAVGTGIEELGTQIADLLQGLSPNQAMSALAHAESTLAAREAQARLYDHLRGVLVQLEVYLPKITGENPSLFDLYHELSAYQRMILRAVIDELVVLERRLAGLSAWTENLHQLRTSCLLLLRTGLTEADDAALKERPAITRGSIAQLMQAIPAA